MKTVKYTCSFVPAEWIAAHGLRPERIIPSSRSSDSGCPITGVCAFIHALMNSICSDESDDALILTTVCDQMRHVPDLLSSISDRPVFLMNVPSTWQGKSSWKLYLNELERLGMFLQNLGGTRPTEEKLIGTMLEYEELRNSRNIDRPAHKSKVPLAFVGGELRQDDMRFFELIEQAGGWISLDATDYGHRGLPAKFDRRNIQNNPLMELTDAYFASIPHAFRRPNTQLYQYLKKELKRREIRGIVFRRYQWCDIWNAEIERLRQWVSLPVLQLDIGSEGVDDASIVNRIQGFMELFN